MLEYIIKEMECLMTELVFKIFMWIIPDHDLQTQGNL